MSIPTEMSPERSGEIQLGSLLKETIIDAARHAEYRDPDVAAEVFDKAINIALDAYYEGQLSAVDIPESLASDDQAVRQSIRDFIAHQVSALRDQMRSGNDRSLFIEQNRTVVSLSQMQLEAANERDEANERLASQGQRMLRGDEILKIVLDQQTYALYGQIRDDTSTPIYPTLQAHGYEVPSAERASNTGELFVGVLQQSGEKVDFDFSKEPPHSAEVPTQTIKVND